HFVNLNNLASLRTPQFELPPLESLVIQTAASGLPARNIDQAKAELKQRWHERLPDSHGLWKWKVAEYVLVSSAHPRPFDQPLTIFCVGSARPNRQPERRCQVTFYWTLGTGVRYAFFDSEIPESKWVELDRSVLEFMQFLSGNQVAR
ncbi:MAG TPA: hypothetical protein VFY21_10490, partial [Xanthobacteraceae bacterium]|nr:hypothetical protein [Xanthobacteraceae bacterium]